MQYTEEKRLNAQKAVLQIQRLLQLYCIWLKKLNIQLLTAILCQFMQSKPSMTFSKHQHLYSKQPCWFSHRTKHRGVRVLHLPSVFLAFLSPEHSVRASHFCSCCTLNNKIAALIFQP